MTINTISTLPTAPARTDAPATFVTRADAFLAALVVMQGELNTSIGQMNTDIAGVNADATAAANSAAAAIAAANFKGNWSDLTGALDIPASVAHSGGVWVLLTDLPDVTASEPSGANTDWQNLPVIPNQSGESGKFLTTDGSVTSWAALSTDPVLATLSKTFVYNESATMTLSSAVAAGAPVVSATKEIPQTGVTNNNWQVNSAKENYSRKDTAYSTTLDFEFGQDISGIVNTQTINVEAQDTVARTIQFKPDGTKMYYLGGSADGIYEYDLSVAWDLSTAVYNGTFFDLTGQEINPFSIFFKEDGLRFYVVGTTGDDINEYSLSTAWDVSSASFSRVSNGLAESNPRALYLSSDGTKVFVIGTTRDRVDRHVLSTAWDISSMNSTPDQQLEQAGLANPESLLFQPDGLTLYIIDGSTFYEYILSTAWDLTSATFNQSIVVTSNIQGAYISNDLQYLFVINTTENIYRFDNPVSKVVLGTGSFSSDDVGKTIEANSGQLQLKATDGSVFIKTSPTSTTQVASGDWEMYSINYNSTNDNLEISNIVLPFGAAYVATNQFVSINTAGKDIAWRPNGLSVYIIVDRGAEEVIEQYDLSVAWDISTASFVGKSFDIGSYGTSMTGLYIVEDGSYVFTCTSNSDTIARFVFGTNWDITTLAYNSDASASASSENQAIFFKPDGSKMYVLADGSAIVAEYTLTAWNLATLSVGYVAEKNINAQEGDARGLTFSPDGTSMFIVGIDNVIYQYDLSTPWLVSSATFTKSSAISVNRIAGLAFKNDGLTIYGVDEILDRIYQFDCNNGLIAPTGYQTAITQASIDTTYWTDVNSMAATENAQTGAIYYCLSKDARTTWVVLDNTDGERSIARNNAGTWEYNSNVSYTNETWTAASVNTEYDAISESMSVTQNQMSKSKLDAITDANQITLSNDLDFAVSMNLLSSKLTVSSDSVSINYDANILNEGAVLGTDYDFDFPATDKVRITAINAGNYKVRVV